MADRRVARLADEADQLPGVHARAGGPRRRVAQVHVRVVGARALVVDHEVVAGAGVVARVLDDAAVRGHQRRAAVGERVLALVVARAAEGRDAGAERTAPRIGKRSRANSKPTGGLGDPAGA